MSRYSAITCDVCGKRAAERISDWFEIDAGPDGFFAVHQIDRPAGIGRTSRDICGSRCLCVAMERWANGYLRQVREAATGTEQEAQEWIVPRGAASTPLMLEGGPHRVSLKTQKNAPVEESLPDQKMRRRGVFGKSATRRA
jgi:hypothetical protein